MNTLQRMRGRAEFADQTLQRWKVEREERDQKRVRDHFAKIKPGLFEKGYPDNIADLVLDRVSGEIAWYRIISHHCVLCGRKLTTEQAVRLSMGPECFERFVGGPDDVGRWETEGGAS